MHIQEDKFYLLPIAKVTEAWGAGDVTHLAARVAAPHLFKERSSGTGRFLTHAKAGLALILLHLWYVWF